jgi:hypothetical protein
MLNETKQHSMALDYDTVDRYAAGDIGAASTGTARRCARLQNPDLVYG